MTSLIMTGHSESTRLDIEVAEAVRLLHLCPTPFLLVIPALKSGCHGLVPGLVWSQVGALDILQQVGAARGYVMVGADRG